MSSYTNFDVNTTASGTVSATNQIDLFKSALELVAKVDLDGYILTYCTLRYDSFAEMSTKKEYVAYYMDLGFKKVER